MHQYLKRTKETIYPKHLSTISLGPPNSPIDPFSQPTRAFEMLCQKFGVHQEAHYVKKASEEMDDVDSISVKDAQELVSSSLTKNRVPAVVWEMQIHSYGGDDDLHPHALSVYGMDTDKMILLIHDPNAVQEDSYTGPDRTYTLQGMFVDQKLGISWLNTFKKESE